MKSLPSYTTPSYIGALRTHQSHKHPSRVWRRRCGHTCTQCVWQKQRVARQQHLAFLLSFSASFTLQFFCVSLRFKLATRIHCRRIVGCTITA
mgnify:CR=1 FL=1